MASNYVKRLTTSITGTNILRDRPLMDDELRTAAPSAFSTDKHDSRSDRYTHIPTYATVLALRKEGFEPFFAVQSNTKDETRIGHTKHLIRFRRTSQIQAPRAEEICLINSSDASCGGQLLAAITERVCQNACIVGSVVKDIRVRHTGNVVNDFIEGSYSILNSFETVRESIDDMLATQLNKDEQMVFARSAMALRYDKVIDAPISPMQLLKLRRREENTSSLYTTFQVVQENLVRAGLIGTKADAQGKIKHVRTRPINSITENTKINQALWQLAEGMRQIKNGAVAV